MRRSDGKGEFLVDEEIFKKNVPKIKFRSVHSVNFTPYLRYSRQSHGLRRLTHQSTHPMLTHPSRVMMMQLLMTDPMNKAVPNMLMADPFYKIFI